MTEPTWIDSMRGQRLAGEAGWSIRHAYRVVTGADSSVFVDLERPHQTAKVRLLCDRCDGAPEIVEFLNSLARAGRLREGGIYKMPEVTR